MLLDSAHDWLGWPDPQLILDPPGEGVRVYADFAKRKIELALKRDFPNLAVETGVLAPDPCSIDTSSPLAIVCQFPRGAQLKELEAAHRLAWNFSKTSLLITLEPHRLIAWSCYSDPLQPDSQRRVCELETVGEFRPAGTPEQRRIRDLLHWVSLVTGHIRQQHAANFPPDGRADALLLKNLCDVRRRLLGMGLARSFCHDLLARIIFVQYLFQRRDSDGNAFFSDALLARRCGGVLQNTHADFASILRSHSETYALFRWLDGRFNGDLFPGSDESSEEDRELAWQTERDAVSPAHLNLLADLVAGTIDTTDRQLLLWPQYSFDTIPLEFISSVYEEFLNEDRFHRKAFYTPPHLVDYVLDAVLPWNGDNWDIRILDPACGSGIFLVKAFQRLIYRWRRAHRREPLVSDLKPLLAENLMGVDISPDAVRVASFSLYLTMADAIEPKHYVVRDKVFPQLRGRRLIESDFFDETSKGFRTSEDASTFDLVIGNAPWGDNSVVKTSEIALRIDHQKPRPPKNVLTKAQLWAKEHDWPIANNDIGPLFLAKGLHLLNDAGRLAIVQPAGPWLYHRAPPALRLRHKLFTTYVVEEVTNLAAIRRELFTSVIGPACVIVTRKVAPLADTALFYFTPKPAKMTGATQAIVIEPQDVTHILHADAASDSWVWSVLAFGGQRDLALTRRLRHLATLAKLEAEGRVSTRLGVIPGDRKRLLPELLGKRYLQSPQFPAEVFMHIDAEKVPRWENPCVHSKDSTDFDPFKQPQLLIKSTLSVRSGRFRAALVRSSDPEWGIICKKTYLSVRDASPDGASITASCLVYNSIIAVYFLTLISSRLGHYITEIPANEILQVPIPDKEVDLSALTSFDEIDAAARTAFALSEAEWALVEDLVTFALPDALRQSPGPGRQRTDRGERQKNKHSGVALYAETFCRVLKHTFGSDKRIAATIYEEPESAKLPVRMLSLQFDSPKGDDVNVERIEADGLLDKLSDFHREALQSSGRPQNGDGLGFQRVAFLLHSHGIERPPIRTLTVIKPDECRYWTRSLAMRDADELSFAILKAAGWRDGAT